MSSIFTSSKTLKKVKKDNVLAFVIGFFKYLKKYQMCFISGSIIFEDDNNRLFNLLTYGELDYKGNECNLENALASSHITITHKEVFKKPDVKVVEDDEKCITLNRAKKSLKKINGCQDGRCFKLELVFKKPIKYLCGEDDNVANMSPKQIILYYRFKHNNKKYLFFKLEAHPINSLSHLKNYISQSRRDTYDKRRENNSVYDENIKRKDLEFTKNFILEELGKKKIGLVDKLDYYDSLLRTGKELFIFEELKEFFLDKILPFYITQLKKMN